MSPIDYAARQNNYNKRRQPGTGQEFLTSEEFQVWLQSEKQTLYCPGIPGAGKTMITSIVIDHISSRFQTELDTCIAYLYFEYARRDEQNLENLLESLLKQLAQQLFEHTESLPKGLKELYANHTPRKSRPTIYELLKILENVVSSDRRTFIVVDALDECQNDNGCRSKFVAHIFELQDKGRLNFFATSHLMWLRPHSKYVFHERFVLQKTIYIHTLTSRFHSGNSHAKIPYPTIYELISRGRWMQPRRECMF